MAVDEDYDGTVLTIFVLLGVAAIIGFLCLAGSIIGFLLPGKALWPCVLLSIWAANSLPIPVIVRLSQRQEEFWRKKDGLGMWYLMYIVYLLGMLCVVAIDFLLIPIFRKRLARTPHTSWE